MDSHSRRGTNGLPHPTAPEWLALLPTPPPQSLLPGPSRSLFGCGLAPRQSPEGWDRPFITRRLWISIPGKKNLDGWVRSAGRGEFWNLANCRVGCCGEGGSGIGCGGLVCVEAWWACGWVALAVECSAGWQRFVPGRRVLIRMSVRRVRANETGLVSKQPSSCFCCGWADGYRGLVLGVGGFPFVE